MATPSVEDLLQQLIQGQQRTMERIDAIVVQSTNTNTRIDEVLKRVEDIELAQSLSVYHPTSAPEDVPNPLLLNTKRSTERSKSSSPTNSDADDKESSIANPGNKEDLAAVSRVKEILSWIESLPISSLPYVEMGFDALDPMIIESLNRQRQNIKQNF
jgi:hypothetical protein